MKQRMRITIGKSYYYLEGSLRSKRFRAVSVLPAREMKREPKNERGGKERGGKETLADKPLDFENLRSPANAVPDWLSYFACVDQRFVPI